MIWGAATHRLTIAATHLPAPLTIAAALVIFAVVVWYWLRLGRAEVPASRRRVRRWSMLPIVAILPVLVSGFSFIDGDVDAPRYVLTWSTAFVLLMLIFLAALVDAWNNLRLHAQQADKEAVDAAGELLEAIQARRKRDKAARSSASKDDNS